MDQLLYVKKSFNNSLPLSFSRVLFHAHTASLSHARASFFYDTQKIKIRKTFYTSPIIINLENGLAISPNGQTVDFLCLAVTGTSGCKDPPLGGVQQRSVHHSQTLIPPGQTQLRSARGAEETHTK